MTNFYTSDWHLSIDIASNMAKFINSKVKPDDSLFVLGDLSMFEDNEIEQTKAFLDLLECNSIYICEGNHDSTELCAELIKHPKVKYVGPVLNVADRAFGMYFHAVLSHYPIIDYHMKHNPVMMLHGHCHGMLGVKLPDLFDVGVDNQDYYPVTIEELLSKHYGDHSNPYMGYMEHLREFKNDFYNFMKKHNR